MNYTFNKTMIEQVKAGTHCIEFKREKDSLEMLQALLRETFPKDKRKTKGICNYYRKQPYTNDWLGTDLIEKPPIPLSNFVQPEQSERDVFAELDERLKRLEDILLRDNEPCKAEPKPKWTPKVGEWFKREHGCFYYCTTSNENGISGDNQNGGTIVCGNSNILTKPTGKEVEDYMVGLAKEKYPVGTQIKTGTTNNFTMPNTSFKYELGDLCVELPDSIGWFILWSNGKWAKIVNPVRWRAEWNNKYYYLSDELDTETGIERLDKFDDKRYAVGNYFQTAQQSEEMAVLMQFTLNNPELVKQLIDKKE